MEDPTQEENEVEEIEEEDPLTKCPYFTTSDQFHFMSVKEFERREDANRSEESDYSFGYVRPMGGVLGVLENAHGSVRLSQGETTVIAAVYGPSDVRMSKELPHRAAVDVLFRPKVTGSGNNSSMMAAGIMDPIIDERAMEQTIASVLESVIHLEDHLQAGFNVILHEVEDKGCLLSTCINAASLALLNAGCSLRCMFAAVTVCVSGDSIVIDPSSEQIDTLKKRSSTPFSILTFTVTNTTEKKTISPQVLHMSSLGVVDPKTLSKVYKLVTDTDLISEIFCFFWRTVSSDVVGACGGGGSNYGGGLDDVRKMEGEGRGVRMETETDDSEDGEVKDE